MIKTTLLVLGLAIIGSTVVGCDSGEGFNNEPPSYQQPTLGSIPSYSNTLNGYDTQFNGDNW